METKKHRKKVDSGRSFKELFNSVVAVVERHSLLISLSSLCLGLLVGELCPAVGETVSHGVSKFVDAYSVFVPFLLYFLLSSALVKMVDLTEEHGSAFIFWTMTQFVGARLFAILFAILGLSFIFHLPFTLDGALTPVAMMRKVGVQLWEALTGNPFLYGVYAALATVPLATKFPKVKNFFVVLGDWIEAAGQALVLITPAFMLAVGAFFTNLPQYAAESLSSQGFGAETNIMKLIHIVLPHWVPEKYTFVWMYLMMSGMTAVFCLVWHALYIAFTRMVQPNFSIRRYVSKYWVEVYPLLWASSSESLGVPLSLARMKVAFPEVPDSIRRFVIAGGSYLGINGTLICVYVMGVMLANFVGVQISILQLLVSLPVIFLMGYTVPGIPGELILFADTMSLILGIPPAIKPLFVALYLTMQIGLPDSFRTGCNSTDSALLAITTCRHIHRMDLEPDEELEPEAAMELAVVLNDRQE
ncbi:MAG: cation:dicarboxylase symporter family transporter [Candidatus Ozemobacteraceae bacterium]